VKQELLKSDLRSQRSLVEERLEHVTDIDAYQTLHNKILEVRDCGEVTFCIAARTTSTSSVKALLDDFVVRFNFFGLADGWKEIDLVAAKQIVSEIIFRDLAHGTQMTTGEHACLLAEEFLGIFEQSRFFTNAIFENGTLSTWYPVSKSTFDTGVVCLDDTKIGILWVQDED